MNCSQIQLFRHSASIKKRYKVFLQHIQDHNLHIRSCVQRSLLRHLRLIKHVRLSRSPSLTILRCLATSRESASRQTTLGGIILNAISLFRTLHSKGIAYLLGRVHVCKYSLTTLLVTLLATLAGHFLGLVVGWEGKVADSRVSI